MIPPLIQTVSLSVPKNVTPFCLPKIYVSHLCSAEKFAFHSSLQNTFLNAVLPKLGTFLEKMNEPMNLSPRKH